MPKIKVLSYQQMIDVLTEMVASGRRAGADPFCVGNTYFEFVEDRRTSEILAHGEIEITPFFPHLKL